MILNSPLTILKVTTAFMFLGWGLLHLFWDIPYREILWSEWLFRPVLEFFGGDWQSYLGNTENDKIISWFTRAVGVVFLAFSVFSFTKFSRSTGKFLLIGSAAVLVIHLLYFKESGFKWGLLIEQVGQISTPAILYLFCFGKLSASQLRVLVKAAIAVTFLFHGLFALGLFSVPGNFIDMIISIFGVSEETARTMLLVAGILDVILAVTIFVPDIEKPVLIYAVFWGIMTSLARPASSLGYGGSWESFIFWAAQLLIRAPHFGLALFLLKYRKSN